MALNLKPQISYADEAFMFRENGRYAIRHAGVLVHRAFDTEREATEWAKWNYLNRANWIVEQMEVRREAE